MNARGKIILALVALCLGLVGVGVGAHHLGEKLKADAGAVSQGLQSPFILLHSSFLIFLPQ